MKRTNFYLSFKGLMASFTMVCLALMGTVTVSTAQTLACKQAINVQLSTAPTCTYVVQVADVAASNQTGTVAILRGGTVDAFGAATVVSSDIGRNGVQAVLFTGATYATATAKCWTNVTVEDKTPPTLVCPGNVTVNCSTPTTPYFTGDFGIIAAKGLPQTLAPGAANGTFYDCTLTLANSALTDEAYTDAVSGTICAGNYLITRTFRVTDHFGNTSLPCTQLISVDTAHLFSYHVDTLAVSCTSTDFSPAGLYAAGFRAPNKSAYPYFLTDTLKTAIGSCINSTFTDLRMDVCPGSYMIMRTWKLFYCNKSVFLVQPINVTNTTPPVVSATFNNYAPVASQLCYRDLWGNIQVLPANLQCTAVPRTFRFSVEGRTVTNIPKGSVYGCTGDAFFSFTIAAPACGGFATITSNDSRFVVTGSGANYSASAFGLPFGSTVVTFTATDPCSGLTSILSINVNVVDNVLPEPVCIQSTRASIGSDGAVRIPASALNSGSHDNCGIQQIFASRMDQMTPAPATAAVACGTLVPDLCAAAFGGKDNRIYSDYVTLGCADIGKTVQVLLGVLDVNGNFNFCMVNVAVDNKVTPTCIPPAAKTIPCSLAAATLANLKSLGTPLTYTNCGTATVVENAPTGSLDNCKLGTITRNFTVSDCTGANSITCSQAIKFTSLSDFVVDFPDDITVSCLSAIPAADSLRNQMLDPASFAKGLDGSILNRGCGVLNVNVNDANYVANPGQPRPDVCGKILRKITVIDWCKYNPNNDLTDANANCYGNPVLGDYHGYAGQGVQGVTAGAKATNLAAWQDLDPYRAVDGPAGNYSEVWAAANGYPTVAAAYAANPITAQDRRFEDADLYSGYGPLNLNLSGFPTGQFFNPTHPLAFSDGILCYIQIIKIIDNVPPTTTFRDTVVCDYGSGVACYGAYKFQIPVTDGCGGKSTNFSNGNGGVAASIRITYNITNAAGTIVFQSSSTDFSGLIQDPSTGLGVSLPYGVYTVTYTATDLCMNIAGPFSYKLTIKDCKTPSLTCYQTVSALMNAALPGQGTVQVWASEILSSVNDNCTSDADLKKGASITIGSAIAPVPGQVSLPINCNDYILTAPSHIFPAKVWISDAAGNTNYCFVNIQLQDNGGACNRPAVAPLSGAVRTETSQAINAVTVNANVNGTTVAGSSLTDANGAFGINSLALGANYQVKAAKANMGDRATDVTTYDIALISRHVLGIKALNSPYKIIAADVDKSGEVDATDMLHMRRFILGITSSLPAGTWRFIDKSYAFKNPTAPFGEDFPEYVNINAFTATQSANFVAIEIGDVNNSYEFAPSAQVRTAKTVTLNADDMNVIAGNEYTVNVTASDLNASALQGTFNFEGATVTSLKPGNLNGIADANFNVKANAVATSWNGEAAKDATVAAITFRADKSGKLSEMLSFGSSITKSEANDAQGNTANVTLKFNTGKVSGGEFALYQNTPNPVENSTKIGFNLPSDQTARLSVVNVEGKVMMVKSINGKAGYNEVSISKSELGVSGVFHYRLDTQDNTATKKMIIIE